MCVVRLTSGERNSKPSPLAAAERAQQPPLPADRLQRRAGRVRGEEEALAAEPPAPMSCQGIQALEQWMVSCEGHNSLVLLAGPTEG